MSTWQNTKSWKKLFIVSFSYEITYEKLSTIFLVKGILKIFEFSFIQDQSQVCISNGLKVIAHQSETLIILNSFSLMELWKRFLTIFTLFFTTPKRLKIKNFSFWFSKVKNWSFQWCKTFNLKSKKQGQVGQ